MRTETNWSGVVDFGAITSGDLIGADEVPGSPHARAGIKVAMRAHLCAEEAQQHRTPRVSGTRREAIEDGPAEVPGETRDALTQRKCGAKIGILCRFGRDVFCRVVVELTGIGSEFAAFQEAADDILKRDVGVVGDLNGRFEADVAR